jgi:hypothetical protein
MESYQEGSSRDRCTSYRRGERGHCAGNGSTNLPRRACGAGQRRSDSVASAKPPKPVKGAHPLAKNKYKVPLTKAVVKRTLLSLIA